MAENYAGAADTCADEEDRDGGRWPALEPALHIGRDASVAMADDISPGQGERSGAHADKG